MENNKGYKGIMCLLVVLIILVVFLIGLVIYKGFFVQDASDRVNDVSKVTNNVNIDEDNKNVIKNINDFPKENSNGIKNYNLYDYVPSYSDLKENMNSTFKLDGTEFSYSVSLEDFDKLNVYVNDNVIATVDYDSNAINVLITNKYIVVQNENKMNIYEKDGVLKKKVVNVVDEVSTDCNNSINTIIKVVDNKLYYTKEFYSEEENVFFVSLNYIDLNNNFKENLIQEYELSCPFAIQE